MKLNCVYPFLTAALLLLSSCAQENLESESERPLTGQGRVVEISAGLREAGDSCTKVSVAKDGKVTWVESDRIAIFNTEGTKFTFYLVSGAGTSLGSFRCDSFVGELGNTAVYPASYAGSSEGEITYPSVKNYDAAEPVPVVMTGSLAGSPVQFEHVGGVIELNMYDIPAYARAIRVESTAFSLEIRFPSKTGYGRNTTFYVPSKAGDLGSLYVKFLDGDGDVIEGTESIKIPSKYTNINVRDYIAMPQLNVRSKVTRTGYIKVEGIKWALGNLRFDISGTTGSGFQSGWNLAANQYDFFHTAGESSYTLTQSKFDRFNWGGTGRRSRFYSKGNQCHPSTTSASIVAKLFSDTLATKELYGDDRYVDCGYTVSGSIWGDVAMWASKGKYRLPSTSEIQTLYYQTSAPARASSQYGFVTVDSEKIYGELFTSSASWETSTNSTEEVEFTAADLESGLFLPKAGWRHSDNSGTVIDVGGEGCYWTGTFGDVKYSTGDCVKALRLKNDNTVKYGHSLAMDGETAGAHNKLGFSIRPVVNEIPDPEPPTPGTIKVLTIGNSFSRDAVEYHLAELFKAAGRDIIIGNAYRSGCSLEEHCEQIASDAASYSYRKVVNCSRTVTASQKLSTILKDEQWDYISFQQGGGDNGFYETFDPDLTTLMTYAREKSAKSDFKAVFHVPWAAAAWCNTAKFGKYDYDQKKMYDACMDAAQKVVADHTGNKTDTNFEMVVVTGTAIQNGRTSYLGDSFNFYEDGWHLNTTFGRYTAACTWFEMLTGTTVVGNSYYPSTISAKTAATCQSAAHYACVTPYSKTDISSTCPEPTKENTTLAAWKFSAANAVSDGYKTTWTDSKTDLGDWIYSNAAGSPLCYVDANYGGQGKLTFVQKDKSSYTSSDNRAGRMILAGNGTTTGGQPALCGVLKNDYIRFNSVNSPAQTFLAGTKFSFQAALHPYTTGPKYWLVEWYDGSGWEPVFKRTTATINGESVTYNLTLSSDTKKKVTFNVVLSEKCTHGFLVRFTCASNTLVNGKCYTYPLSSTKMRVAGLESSGDLPVTVKVY